MNTMKTAHVCFLCPAWYGHYQVATDNAHLLILVHSGGMEQGASMATELADVNTLDARNHGVSQVSASQLLMQNILIVKNDK